MFQEEAAALHKQIDSARQERNSLKAEFAGIEARYRGQVDSAKTALADHKKQIETAVRERDEGRKVIRDLRKQVESMATHLSSLKKQVEKLGNERDEWKQAAQKKKQKMASHEKLKDQVMTSSLLLQIVMIPSFQFSHYTNTVIELTEAVEKLKRERRDFQKSFKKAEDKVKKLEKAQSKATRPVVPASEHERLYEEERDRNQVMCVCKLIMMMM